MNIFIVHSGEDIELAKQKKEELCEKCGKARVLLLEYRKMMWKREARQLIKQAQMILYLVGENSSSSRNIRWELKKALQYGRSVICYKLAPQYPISPILKSRDPFTHEEILLAEEVGSIDEIADMVMNYERGNYIDIFNENGMEEAPTREELFEQYRLFSETSEALVNRRQNVNSFYITANTAIITIAATAFSMDGELWSKLIVIIALTIPGILLNGSWRKILESYGIINSSKMKIISLIEKRLAASLYDAEWQVMSNKFNKTRYVSFTDGEKTLPLIFVAVYVFIDVICIYAMIVVV